MAKRAIFHRDFEYDHRPVLGMSQIIRAGSQPQLWPAEIIDAAIAAGAAVEYSAPKPRVKLKEQDDGSSYDTEV
jgi:hypothetical protein